MLAYGRFFLYLQKILHMFTTLDDASQYSMLCEMLQPYITRIKVEHYWLGFLYKLKVYLLLIYICMLHLYKMQLYDNIQI